MKYYVRSTHLRLRDYWDKSPYYVATSHNNKKADLNKNFNNETCSNERVCGSYEYMGKDYIKTHIDIRVDYTSDIDIDLLKSDLEYIKSLNKYYITVITGNVNEDNPIDNICAELGIRTQLLYYRGKISAKYKNSSITDELIITEGENKNTEITHNEETDIFTCTITNPAGFNDASISGSPVNFEVFAVSEKHPEEKLPLAFLVFSTPSSISTEISSTILLLEYPEREGTFYR